MAFLYGFSNKRNEEKSIQNIVVQFEAGSNDFLSQSMVNKLLIQNNTSVQNQAKSVIDLYQLENKVLSNPYVEEATLFITVDGILNSTIKQRTPIARVLTSGASYYLDLQGVKVPLSKKYSARVPLVTGVKHDKDLTEIYQLLKLIIADDFLKKEIVGIHKTDSDEYIFAVRSGDYKVEFGRYQQVENKFRKLKAFYNKTFLDKTINNYKTINIKYRNQVVGVK